MGEALSPLSGGDLILEEVGEKVNKKGENFLALTRWVAGVALVLLLWVTELVQRGD